MKRLLCVNSNMNAGGAETFLMKIYRALDKSRYQMDFCINVEGKNFYEDEINAMGGKVYKIPSKSENVKIFKKELARIVKEGQYKYVLRITSNALGFMDLKVAKKAGAVRCCARSSNSSDGAGLKVKIAHRLGKLLYKKYVDVKIAPSELAAKYTFGEKAYNKGQVHKLNNALDLNVFKYDESWRNEVRAEFGLSQDTLVVGHVGRFYPQKNHDFLLDVFNEIRKKKPNSVLVLVGNGLLEEKIKEKAKRLGLEDCIIYAGVRKDVSRVLCAFDVFVFPSFYEGMPNTVIEAQSTGLPCVIADTITREANITGLVKYLSLNDSAEKWADEALSTQNCQRKNTYNDFVDNGYDIEGTANRFTQIIFGE